MPVDPDPRDLCSLERVKRLLRLDADEQTDDDDTLRELITDVTDRFYRDTGREIVALNAEWTSPSDKTFGAITRPLQERVFVANGTPELKIGDLYELDSATVNGTAVDTDAWQLLPYGQPTRRIGFTRDLAYGSTAIALPGVYNVAGDGRVAYAPGLEILIKARWGYETVPASLQGAIAKQVALEAERHIQTFSSTFNIDASRVEIPRGWGAAILDVIDGWRDLGV